MYFGCIQSVHSGSEDILQAWRRNRYQVMLCLCDCNFSRSNFQHKGADVTRLNKVYLYLLPLNNVYLYLLPIVWVQLQDGTHQLH